MRLNLYSWSFCLILLSSKLQAWVTMPNSGDLTEGCRPHSLKSAPNDLASWLSFPSPSPTHQLALKLIIITLTPIPKVYIRNFILKGLKVSSRMKMHKGHSLGIRKHMQGLQHLDMKPQRREQCRQDRAQTRATRIRQIRPRESMLLNLSRVSVNLENP